MDKMDEFGTALMKLGCALFVIPIALMVFFASTAMIFSGLKGLLGL